MADIRLIASDIDGTIIPFGGRISQATLDCIAECRRRGILFALFSGRCYPDALAVAQNAGIYAPLVVANGGCVHDEDGRILREFVMTPEESRVAFDIIKDCGWMLTSYVRGKVFRMNIRCMAPKIPWIGIEPGKEDDARRASAGKPGCRSWLKGWEGRFEIVDDDPDRLEAEGHDRVYKYEVYSKDPDLLARLSRKLTEAGLNCTSSVSTNIEIMSAQAGKGFAVEWLAEHIGATREQTMAFGDNTNDIQMLEAVGWPVAVGNAVPELKTAARLIAPDCDQDGVARTIARIAFGREDSL